MPLFVLRKREGFSKAGGIVGGNAADLIFVPLQYGKCNGATEFL
jgi:hypothetical protein